MARVCQVTGAVVSQRFRETRTIWRILSMEKSKKNYIEKIMAAKAMENMTGRKEKLSEFERKKAQKELQKLSELLK